MVVIFDFVLYSEFTLSSVSSAPPGTNLMTEYYE